MFFKKFFGGKSDPGGEDLGCAQPLEPVVVIGDVHGRADLMVALARKIPGDLPWIFVGDLIDRGEQSAAVLKFVRDISEDDARVQSLMGNHERMLLDFLAAPDVSGKRWLRNGGLQTVASFGLGLSTLDPSGAELTRLAGDLKGKMGAEMIHWLETRPKIWRSGNLSVVHAAADPARDLDDQDENVLIWGQGAFLHNPRRDGHWVAHGHTIVDAPKVLQSRIALDTGAFHSGRLTAGIFDPGGTVEFVST